MPGIPAFLLQHKVSIEAYLGSTGNGVETYAAATTVACFADDKRRLVRATTGEEVVSETTLYAALDTVAPPQSRVTLADGRVATVIQALRRDGGSLPVPSHLEIVLT